MSTEVGPFTVSVQFVDGSVMKVQERVDSIGAVKAFEEHSRGIGAMVGTTRSVVITDDRGTMLASWYYGRGVI
jgi:hypothetical protein